MFRKVETANEQDFYSCLSTDTKLNADVGSQCWETDTGERFESYGLGWRRVVDVQGTNAYEAEDYVADKATSTTSAREPIPTGATSVWVCNESVATTESVRFRFGDVTVVATATTGFRVSPGITTAAGDNGAKCLELPVSAGATHWAYIAEAGTPTINVVWGK